MTLSPFSLFQEWRSARRSIAPAGQKAQPLPDRLAMWRWAGREPVSFRPLTSITAYSAVAVTGGGVLLTGG